MAIIQNFWKSEVILKSQLKHMYMCKPSVIQSLDKSNKIDWSLGLLIIKSTVSVKYYQNISSAIKELWSTQNLITKYIYYKGR